MILLLDVKTKYPELKQSISTKGETILKSEINNRNQQKKTVNPTITKQKSNSLQEAKSKFLLIRYNVCFLY